MNFNLNRIVRLNIRNKLVVAFLTLSSIPVLMSGFYAIHVYTEALQKSELEHLHHDALTVQERTSTFLNGVEGDIRFLSESFLFRRFLRKPENEDALNGFIRQSLDFVRSKGIYYQIRYFDEADQEVVKIRAKGDAYVVYAGTGGTGGRYYRYLSKGLHPGELTSAPVELKNDRGSPTAAISYVLPVATRPRHASGMLVLDVYAEELFRIMEAAHANIGGKIMLVSDEGYYVYHSEKKRNWSRLLAARVEHNIYKDYPADVAGRIMSGDADMWISDRDVITCMPLLQNAARKMTAYILCMSVPRERVLASVIRFERVFYGLLVIFVVLSVVFAYRAAAQFTRPINALQAEAAVIAGGEFGRRLQVETYDETQRLAETFNTMAQAIQEREVRIRRHEGELEAMVAARTEELEEEKWKLQAILDSVPSAFVLLDRQLRILSASRSFERISGYKPEAVIGESYEKFFPECERGADCPAERALHTAHLSAEVQRLQPPGRENARYLERIAIPVNQHGRVERVIEVVTDVTERKEMESRVIHSEKLATTGEMASVIAHEMRNSLTSVKMILQLELERENLKAADREGLDVAVRSVQRMETIVTDLLKFARPAAPDFQPQSVNTILQEALALIQHQIRRKSLTLEEDFKPALPRVQGDADQLKEVWVNLLLNAAQAAPEGGKLAVTTRLHPTGAWVEAVVSDSGRGIPEDHIERIFDPFFTTKPEGTGLGLSMVRRSVEAHGGTISVMNEPGGGARFTVRLPVDGVDTTAMEMLPYESSESVDRR